MVSASIEPTRKAFAATLREWRSHRGLSKKELAGKMHFDASYVSHLEGCRHRPTAEFARRAEAVLEAQGEIWNRFLEYEESRRASFSGPPPRLQPGDPRSELGSQLTVVHEIASLSYRDRRYRCTIRRYLYNGSTSQISYYPVRIMVDRFPDDPARSRRCYRERPLTWAELGFRATRGRDVQDDPREPMEWRATSDRDAYKKAVLLFGRFPLHHGDTAVIEYSFSVGDEKWGQWFERHIWLPTRRLTVCLDFPAGTRPALWGLVSSFTSSEAPLPTPVRQRTERDRVKFEWSVENPLLHGYYRLEWSFARNDQYEFPHEPVDGVVPACARRTQQCGGAHLTT